MSNLSIGIVDYGMGNHASVMHSLKSMGFKVRISDDLEILDRTDILILPGVGAFPSAMQALHDRGLVNYLQKQAEIQRPIIGICLGMQLLTTASYEFDYTLGLNLIEGEIVPLTASKWHIGWNTIKCIQQDSLITSSDAQAFYFNHSFTYQGADKYQIAISQYSQEITAAICNGNIVGLQFHPEKSQYAGRELLKNLILGLTTC
ncbi:MAG: imidazole glycerol phosphate synthase subunit HisH [Pseudanabaena sp. M57BS1SP1A06MG]|jgi:glutamine amidotransferase|nr:imidazole glycerol phosphate synthase subunit HisH [Pseudanabaena sp. M53BS1SP1A06MG]MCA6583283.1 imidazole glycerol phosphate synthase subunit HisH [Pseudanabaena sp. M34BS1SP1A06MG]MCA6591057.1 imidazole glycerol phosphate synthase subunit HisH [Pseudanabaena sp. M38BS1SP1A06MG]MCA6601115.1 imidazole glycerol phosphate synthase subunit HisH [Pseudanabaena sp. M57BS1SP1A06MG]